MPVSYSPSLNVSDSPSKGPDERFFSGGGGGGSSGPTLLVYDSFTDTNGTPIESHAPDTNNLSGGWVEFGSGSGGVTIVSNACRINNWNGGYYIDADGQTEVICESGNGDVTANNEPALAARVIDFDNLFFIVALSSFYRIRERTGGTITDRATTPHNNSLSDSYWFSDNGEEITAGINRGAAVISYSSTTHNTSKKYGGAWFSNTTADYDDFYLMSGTTDPADLP